MSIGRILLLVCGAILALPATAGPYTDALGACLGDNTNGKERKELAKWIFIGMAAHPEIQQIAQVTPAMHEASDRFMGDLVTRLVTQNCVAQARDAVEKEGPKSFEVAFGTLGQLAMRELMGNAEVSTSLGAWQKYFDSKKFEQLMHAPQK